MPTKALFLDRDGVINEDIGYPHKPEHITFKPGIFDFCRSAIAKGYIVVVVTNQAGVAKGRFTESDVKALHEWMSDRFLSHGVVITGFYFCPYHKDGIVELYRQDSDLRKPRPGMILQAVKDLGIDLASSVMLGDKPSDRIALAVLRSITLKSQYTGSDYDVETLEQALELM